MKDTGGSAFPVPQTLSPYGDVQIYAEMGMSLRDYFAAKAMTSEILRFADGGHPDAWDGIATNAYKIADAMLEARLKT